MWHTLTLIPWSLNKCDTPLYICMCFFFIISFSLGKHCLKPTCQHTYLRKGNDSLGTPIQETKVLPSHDPTVSLPALHMASRIPNLEFRIFLICLNNQSFLTKAIMRRKGIFLSRFIGWNIRQNLDFAIGNS